MAPPSYNRLAEQTLLESDVLGPRDGEHEEQDVRLSRRRSAGGLVEVKHDVALPRHHAAMRE